MTSSDGQQRTDHPPLWRWTLSYSGGRPPRTAQRERSEPRKAFPRWRSARKPLWVEIWHQGGPEGNVRIRAREWEFDFPGSVCILEVVQTINGIPPRDWR